MNEPSRYALASTRIAIGFIFLWAFIDKTFGLKYTTSPERAWLNGGSPTQGYLSSSFGPLGGLFKALAGAGIVDLLFMVGLLAVGVSMILGVATKLGGWSGMAMVLLMYASHPAPWAEPNGTNPLIDTHILQAVVLAFLALVPAGNTWGLGEWWRKKVGDYTWLQ